MKNSVQAEAWADKADSVVVVRAADSRCRDNKVSAAAPVAADRGQEILAVLVAVDKVVADQAVADVAATLHKGMRHLRLRS